MDYNQTSKIDLLNTYKSTEIYYQEYFLMKDNNIYKITIKNIDNEIIIRCKNYQIILNIIDISSLTKIKFDKIIKAYEYITNIFEENKVIIKDIIPNKMMNLLFKIKNELEIDIILFYNKANDFIFNEINKLNKDINNLKDENNKIKKELVILREFHYNKNPKDMKYISDLTNDSYVNLGSNNTFTVFKSINEILYLIYSNKNKSIICYDLNQQKKVTEIKNAHKQFITNFRYYFDSINERNVIMSISCEDNNLRLWDIKNWECIVNLKNVYNFGYLFSGCFLVEKNIPYIVTSNCNNYGNSGVIKIFDFHGNKIKEISNSNEETIFINTYYDEITSRNYILTCNNGYVKSYDYNKNELYRKYYDNENGDHNSLIIKNDDDIIKIIESCCDGNIRIWNFHSGLLLNKIKVNDGRLISICLWNNSYLYVGCSDKTIKLIELKNELVIKSLSGHNNSILTIKKLIHPRYGKCLLSQGWENDHIKLWINKD